MTQEKAAPLLIAPQLEPTMHEIAITGDSANHALKARRLRAGDSVELTNGRGLHARAVIETVENRAAGFSARIDSTTLIPDADPEIVLATALPKGERLSTLVDMATQLGVHRIIPLHCQYSVVRFQPKMLGRLQRVIESACRQSRRCWLPTIDTALDPRSLCATLDHNDLLLVGDHLTKPRQSAALPFNRVVVAVGPEGGFSEQELSTLRAMDATRSVAIGEHILRTETAAVAMLAAAQLMARSSC